jgi:hypothetical protein
VPTGFLFTIPVVGLVDNLCLRRLSAEQGRAECRPVEECPSPDSPSNAVRGKSGEGGVFVVQVAVPTGRIEVLSACRSVGRRWMTVASRRVRCDPVSDQEETISSTPALACAWTLACDAPLGGSGQDPHAGSPVGRNRARRIVDTFRVS